MPMVVQPRLLTLFVRLGFLVTSTAQLLRGTSVDSDAEPLLRPDEPVFSWQTFGPKTNLEIPMQLVLTSREAGGKGLPPRVRSNVIRTLSMDPQLHIRWLDDTACLDYFKKNFKTVYSDMLVGERRGSFRGDLCRAAVLYREGGFYTDLDLQLKVPLTGLVDHNTTFMSSFTADNAILNALIAASPRNPVMQGTLNELRKWYNGDVSQAAEWKEGTTTEWMGPLTMLRGLRTMMEQECPGTVLDAGSARCTCGKQELLFYREEELDCSQDNEECPPSRANAEFQGTRFGIFANERTAASETSYETLRRRIVAWPRFDGCTDWGCQSGGWEENDIQV